MTPLPGTDLWDEVEDQVNTKDWQLFDIVHAVLPTKMPLDEFYRQYAGLWSHANDVRYRLRGRMRVHLEFAAALAQGKVSVGALRKGMRMGQVLSSPKTFLRAHEESPERLSRAAELLLS